MANVEKKVIKRDIEVLTKQVINEKCDILEYLKRENTKIDTSLFPENFIAQFEQKLHNATHLDSEYVDDDPTVISLDDIEDVVQRFDILDRNLQEPKASAPNNIGLTGTQNDIQRRLDSIQFNDSSSQSTIFRDIGDKYKISFDRLNNFFNEIQQIQSKSEEFENDATLNDLDENLIDLMLKLSEVLTQVRFIAENKHVYNISIGIKEFKGILSENLTDIFEMFYRTNKYSI